VDAANLLVLTPIARELPLHAVQLRIEASATFFIFTGIIAETIRFVKALFNILTFH
jgi:hypothetical protein